MNQILIELRNEMTRCARSGCNDRFKELYASNFELQRIKKWLHIASGGGNLELVGFLLTSGFDPNEYDSGSIPQRSLTIACREGQAPIARCLIAANATLNVDIIDDNALFSAIHARSLDCVKLLVDAGIEIHKVYDLGHRHKNALAFAEEEGCTDIAKFLREQGAVLPPVK
jgi:ankyrin repeat protein